MLRGAAIAVVMLVAGQASAELAPFDQLFLRHEAQGSAYELAIARLAVTKAVRPEVKAYAETVVNDHEAYNGALRDLAKAKGVTLPGGMTARAQAQLHQLSGLAGAAFDRAFIREAKRINADDIRDFRRQASRTADPEIRDFVQRFLAVDQKHEDAAKALEHRQVAARMPVIAPPPTGGTMPVIAPPSGGTMPVIPPPAPGAR